MEDFFAICFIESTNLTLNLFQNILKERSQKHRLMVDHISGHCDPEGWHINHHKYSPTWRVTIKYQKADNTKHCLGCEATGLCHTWEYKLVQSLTKVFWHYILKLEQTQLLWLYNCIPKCFHPSKILICIDWKTCITIFIAATFIIAKTGNNPSAFVEEVDFSNALISGADFEEWRWCTDACQNKREGIKGLQWQRKLRKRYPRGMRTFLYLAPCWPLSCSIPSVS